MTLFRAAMLAGVTFTLPAHAQMTVQDPGSYIIQRLGIANQVKELASWAHQAGQMVAQEQQLAATYQALAHVTDLGSAVGALGQMGIRNPLPMSPSSVQGLLNGSGGISGMSSNLGSMFSGTLSGNQVYQPHNDTWLGQELNRNGGGIAGAQSLAMELYRATADRMTHLDNLRDQIGGASDPSARESLIAQLSAEQTAIQNQQVQATVLGNYMQAQLASTQQRVQERRQMEIDQLLDEARAHGINVGATQVAGGGG